MVKVLFIDWHLYNGPRKIDDIDDVCLEHGGLPQVLPLAVHLRFFCRTCRGDHSEPFLLLDFGFGPLVLGFLALGLRVWGQGLTITS